MNNAMITTAFELPGFRVTQSLGVVRGITVRSRSIVGTLFGGIQSLFGGNITIYTELGCVTARRWSLSQFQQVPERSVRSNNTLERTGEHRGRIVLAMDCELADAQWRRWLAAPLGRQAA